MTLEEEETDSKGGNSGEDALSVLHNFKDSAKATPEQLTRLLQHENAKTYFKFNVEQYCELHKLIILQTANATDFVTFLKSEHTFQKVIREREQFSSHFVEIVLPCLVERCDIFGEEVFETAVETVAKCVFRPQEFSCYLNDLFKTEKCTEKHTLCKTLMKFCVSLYSANHFKLIFHAFSKSFKNFSYTYKMLVVLIQMIGFELKDEFNFGKIKYKVDEPTLSHSLQVLNELLSAISKLRVDMDFELNNISFSDFLKKILMSVISLSQTPNTDCYRILMTVIENNPLIIESTINETLIYVMLSDNTNCRKEYETLMVKIFEVFSKLHRTQNLIAKMIPTLKSALDNKFLNETVYKFRGEINIQPTTISHNVDDILPKVVLDSFTNSVISLASWQAINLFKTLLFHLKNAVEELSEGKTENIYLEILSSFTCWMLLSVRMAEHTVAETTVVKFAGGLDELKTILAKFGTTLLQKEHNHVLMRAFLNICYYWAEMYMTLEYYSSSGRIKMEKNRGNNISSCNITYLHPYLSEKEWYLISERINNFGEKPCKEIMQKLMIQKLRALMIFDAGNTDDVTTSISRTLSSDFDVDVFMDEFVVGTILCKMPTNIVMSFAETIVKDLLEKNREIPAYISDSELVTKGILSVIFTRINKLFKQKRKHDEGTPRKALFSKAFATLPPEMFLGNNELGNIIEVISNNEHQSVDLKIHENKIETHFDILTKIPVIFCSESVQKLVILLLLALHRDLQRLNQKCETIIISIVQHSRFTLLDIFEPTVFLKILVQYFDRSADLFSQVAQNVFKSDQDIKTFGPGITHIKENLKEEKCLRFAVIILHLLGKVKKNKISADSKETCSQYKSAICAKITKRVLKTKPEDCLLEAYALVLKTFLAKDENDTLSKLKTCLSEYIEYSLSNTNDENVKGCLLLFTTILHNKSNLTEFNNELVVRIWNTMNNVAIKSDNSEEYSQLVMLIASLIPNEQFSNIFADLLKSTGNSIDSGSEKEFSKHLKTWSCILSTNFNPAKTNVLRDHLEFLLEKLLLVLKSPHYKEDTLEEVIQFEISIIQANHVPLTASIMDFLLLSVSALLMNNSHDFVLCFNSNISLLENLLKYRNPLIMDRLPPFLLQYRLLLKELCVKSSSTITMQENDVQRMADCAHKLEKLTRNLVECTKDMSRIAMYLIADILGQYELDTLYPNVKKHLNNCIYSLISLCDQHAVQYLMRVLSNASTEIFKIMYENYKKYYRFTGKV